MRSKELGPAGDSEETRRRGVNQLNHLEGESGGGNAEGRGVRLRLPLAFRASPKGAGDQSGLLLKITFYNRYFLDRNLQQLASTFLGAGIVNACTMVEVCFFRRMG